MKPIELDEVLLTPEFIERVKAQDPRFNVVDASLRIQQELRDSVVIKAVLEEVGEQAADALEELAAVDPTDTDLIIRHQAKVFRARFVARTLNAIIRKGEIAEQSLNEESTAIGPNNEEQP